MPDRDKVINALHQCVGYEDDDNKYTCIYDGDINPNCPYGGTGEYGVSCMTKMMRDALALLKAQEPVEPILKREGWNKYYNDYVCPVCDQELVYEQNYCSECGRAVKWE